MDYSDDERVDVVLDACSIFAKEQIGDYAPIHVALEYIASQIEELDLKPNGRIGRRIFLEVSRIVLSAQNNPMEINCWLPCSVCGIEILPQIDAQFISGFLSARGKPNNMIKFYRCPDCGGQLGILDKRDVVNREGCLPWQHPDWQDDFDL